MAADPVCGEINHKREPEWLLTNDDKLQNAFVYVTGDPVKALRFELPGSDVALQQVNCQYSPRVLGLRVGQNLVIWNRDPTRHNVHPTPRINVEWNQTHAPQSPPMVKTFPREEALMPIKCNHHPWEKAYVGVMNHPFFAISNDLGSYEIRGLPPGTYKLVAWHEAFDEQQMEITLVGGEHRRIDFTFDLDQGLKKTWPYSPLGSARQ
ncbi:MAG TPA: carboxypeptidase regulatory-like domain-containing protein [Pyrinomonadaceae bacterium]|nr:carboxypeptidase regulatory-like domain-containing protein [Pyrinomonadaceae bacterium]